MGLARRSKGMIRRPSRAHSFSVLGPDTLETIREESGQWLITHCLQYGSPPQLVGRNSICTLCTINMIHCLSGISYCNTNVGNVFFDGRIVQTVQVQIPFIGENELTFWQWWRAARRWPPSWPRTCASPVPRWVRWIGPRVSSSVPLSVLLAPEKQTPPTSRPLTLRIKGHNHTEYYTSYDRVLSTNVAFQVHLNLWMVLGRERACFWARNQVLLLVGLW